jgi:RNA polymerase sigma-70 factor (ECF subfamily)
MAKDILQESFLKAWDNRHLFRGDNFQAWLYTIAHRVCLNHLRSRKNKPTSSYEEGIHAQLHSTRRLEESDFVLRRTIEKAVSDLPLEFREAIILRDYEEYSYKEIADILQIDLSLAKVRVHRARLILRKVLAPMIQESHES